MRRLGRGRRGCRGPDRGCCARRPHRPSNRPSRAKSSARSQVRDGVVELGSSTMWTAPKCRYADARADASPSRFTAESAARPPAASRRRCGATTGNHPWRRQAATPSRVRQRPPGRRSRRDWAVPHPATHRPRSRRRRRVPFRRAVERDGSRGENGYNSAAAAPAASQIEPVESLDGRLGCRLFRPPSPVPPAYRRSRSCSPYRPGSRRSTRFAPASRSRSRAGLGRVDVGQRGRGRYADVRTGGRAQQPEKASGAGVNAS